MTDFLAMGGYAQFVWSAFGFWLVCVIFNIVSARRRIRMSLEKAAARQHHRMNRKSKQT